MQNRTLAIPAKGVPQNHRTIDRVTRILEEVVYRPGMTFAELVRVLDAPKSSVHGFIRGLLASGWLHQDQHRFYLGPAAYGLTLASGHIRAGLVTNEDLVRLHEQTGLAAFLGVQAGDHLIYIAEAGSDHVAGFEAHSNIRRTLLITAGGKPTCCTTRGRERVVSSPRSGGIRSCRQFPRYDAIKRTRIATSVREAVRFAIATTVNNPSATRSRRSLVGPTPEVNPA
jgi:DNA-binding IclR family transcriptional regulator